MAAWQDVRFGIPNVSVAEIMSQRKRRKKNEESVDEESGPSAAAERLETFASAAPSPDADVFWRMNHERFQLLFRDRLLVKAVETRLDRTTAEVFRSMLRLNELSADATSDTSALQSSADIFRLLPADLAGGGGLTMDLFQQHVNVLAEDRCSFVTKTSELAGGGGGGAIYRVNLRRALTNLAVAHVEYNYKGHLYS